MSTISPCKGCTDRTVEPNCHGICEKYLSWSQEQKDAVARKYEAKRPDCAIRENIANYIRKCRKRRHGR